MLFNSPEFIFVFLPLCLAIFYGLKNINARLSISFLVSASLFFYGWWNPSYLILIVFSIIVNFAISRGIASQKNTRNRAKLTLTLGVLFNLGLLGYFKYANFFVDNLSIAIGHEIPFGHVVLPLAISFFTFQQIAFLVDTFRFDFKPYGFIDYCLFVTFFPQLIAGPIVHHSEMMPQFSSPEKKSDGASNLSIGLTIFIIGLTKKLLIADEFALFASPVFDGYANGQSFSTEETWVAVFCYSMQIYFDFSGYSDMAVGIARMFGITLPRNFNSPYKATSIIEFWRRWHITLSRFLRDYLYIPLGGNRKSGFHRFRNLFLTMLIGGFWHGAGWTFVIWGALHGTYLIINHFWRFVFANQQQKIRAFQPALNILGLALTFIAVCFAWVFFRSPTVDSAVAMILTMLKISDWQSFSLENTLYLKVALGFFIIWALPNTQQIMKLYKPVLEHVESSAKFIIWRPSFTSGAIVALLLIACIFNLQRTSEFIYFQF
ncbi:MAG: MBOAT family protein [Cyanobacteria bacterium P01_F01_bin.86]